MNDQRLSATKGQSDIAIEGEADPEDRLMNMKVTKKFKLLTLLLTIVIGLSVVFLHLLSHSRTQTIYAEEIQNTIISLKKEFLMDTVDNLFSELDALRQSKAETLKISTDIRLNRLQDELDLPREDFIRFFSDRFGENPDLWSALLWDPSTGTIVYELSAPRGSSPEEIAANMKAELSSSGEVQAGDLRGLFGIRNSHIDGLVKDEIAKQIRQRRFANGAYIWVNEIKNYEGGNDYAIRRVHPNLPKTEGMLLSTEMEDIRGNKPYQMELDGIRANGEIFFNYYFKKLDTDEVSEKLSYARLYEDYDWVIAMGVNLDEIDMVTQDITREMDSLASETMIHLLGYILLILGGGFLGIYLLERNHMRRSQQRMEKEFDTDVLTGAANRRTGERYLHELFLKFHEQALNVAILMFDVDNFKQINDHYGHAVGDQVLGQIAQAVSGVIGSRDHLIRWGGDEFVGIFPGLGPEELHDIALKIHSAIQMVQIPAGGGLITATLSMGLTAFDPEDESILSALKRTDEGLYQAKAEGKNQFRIVL